MPASGQVSDRRDVGIMPLDASQMLSTSNDT